MALLKCKMCGGDLEIIEGSTVCICEYCGTKQTVPTLDNEKKIALFTRANRLRLGSEFDKAYSIYESILIDYPEEAEAYWGLVLCKYGIEYVDDPKTATKVPTCHRSSFESIFDDSNFELAIEYADATARAVYREEAKAIEEIRKGIIEISSHEEPYDIFICYKETDEGGSRTIDSVIAQDVYDALVSKGYRVFFARISLEDKLGKEYEPYIFSALHSSKVMLVFGTDYEYFNAVWVKNEWSRFLKLIETDKEKALIPCYKDIDAYDMPKEFRKLQAQDMGKVGAIQDLLRGIGKILSNKKQAVNKEVENTATTPTADIFAPFLKKAKQQLKNGKFEEAKISYQKVLEFAPTLEEALVGSFLSAQKVSSLEKLEAETSFFNTSNEYLLLCESASDELNAKLSEALEKIKQNNISALDGAMHSKRFDDARTYIENLKSYDSDSVNEEELYFLIDVKASSFEELENGTVAFYDNKIYKSAAGDFKARLDDALSKIEGNIKKAKLESVLSENNVTRVCDLPDSYLVKNCKRLDWIYEIISEEEGQALRERISSLTTNNKKKKPLAIIAVLIVVALAVIIAIVVGVSAILISRLNNNGDTSTDTENTDTGSTETDSTDTDSSGNEGGENEGGNDSSDSNTGNEGDNAGNEGAGDNNTGVGGEGTGNEDPTTLIIPDGTVAIKSGEYANNTTITKVVIPSSVKTIDASAFSGCTSLESVTIPNGVTSIADEAFEGCTNLTSLEIPSSVTEIGNFAFKDCTSLTIIVIPDSVTSVGDYAFRGCINVTNIVIPGETTVIGQNAFDGCSKVESATVPSAAISYVPKETLKTVVINAGTSIEDEAFKDCISLTTVEIPNSVTSIGESAFSGCVSVTRVNYLGTIEEWCNIEFSDSLSNPIYYAMNLYINGEHLTELVIPDTVTEIKAYAFECCTSLTSITIPNSVTSIGESAFYCCTSLISITMPNNITSIGRSMFKDCSSLVSITIPEGVTSIGDFAFENCRALMSITIPENVTSIGDYAFEDCRALTKINFNAKYMDDLISNNNVFSNAGENGNGIMVTIGKEVTRIPAYLFSNNSYHSYDYSPKITSIVFEEGSACKSIRNSAFRDITSLVSLTMPNSITSIGEYAFYYCTSLTSINYLGTIEGWCNIEFANFSANPLYYAKNLYINGEHLTELVIPDSITEIKDYAFEYCTSLTSITIPDSVTSIGESALYGCTNLTSITIPDSVTSIGESAFYGCTNLTSITIPDSVTSIEERTFYYCTSLISITIPDSVTSIGECPFFGCTILTIHCEITSKPSGWSSKWNYSNCPVVWGYIPENDQENDETILTIPVGTVKIPDRAYENNTTITTLIIPEGVTHIGASAFQGCVNLTNIIMPNTVISIGEDAFAGCDNVVDYDVPSIGYDHIPPLKSKVFVLDGADMEEYQDNANIEKLVISGDIYHGAFAGCINLKYVEIMEGVSEIKYSAFAGCTSLKSVTISNTVTGINEGAFSDCVNLEKIVIPTSVVSIDGSIFDGCTNLTIYCEAESMPSGWDSDWNPENRPVVWGYTGE